LPLRSIKNRVVAGVGGGIGESIGLDPAIVRAGFVVLALAGGAGVILYVLGWIVLPEALDEHGSQPTFKAGMRQVAGAAAVVLGLLLLLREIGWWFGDAVVWPVAVAILGANLIWLRSEGAENSRLRRAAARISGNPVEAVLTGPVSRPRLVLGALLIVAGTAAFLAANTGLEGIRTIAFPVAVTIAGLSLIFGPWLARLARQASDERRERIRSQERSEMAAHLHDSVLQTLALIQRSDSSRKMASLARTQERELRAWLYGRTGTLDEDSIRAAVDALAGRVEQMHHIRVDAVVVGDAPLDERARALVQACGEAMMNAAKHSGVEEVSVYVETDGDGTVAYVRDEGVGFDPAAVPPDRRGITESIRTRMERFGGNATITSRTGRGTEVQLRLPAAR
jgi:signal transduction histidine kinase/phage shock protein PspC (stress-responsive transcriptional regulator)